jgi:5-methyltetrahydrofolate--homocysteine methyltransferase
MITVVKELKRAGVDVPVMIAGATTSPLHTALKIAPLYDGAVVHVKDVSQNVVVAAELLGGEERREAFITDLRESQGALRSNAVQRSAAPLRSLDEARANKPDLFG